MAYFGPLEWVRVALCRPELRTAVLAVMADWEGRYPGQHLFVPYNGGFRAEGVQASIVAAGDGRAAPPGDSAHEYGAAIDLQIVGTDQDARRDHLDERYRTLASLAVAHGLRAGYNFSGDPDPYHLELSETLETMKAQWDGLKKKGSLRLSSSSGSES